MTIHPPFREVFDGVATREEMFRLFNHHRDDPDVDPLSGKPYSSEWFEVEAAQYHFMLGLLPPLFQRSGMFGLSEYKSGNVTSVFFAIRIRGRERFFHGFCDLGDRQSPHKMRAAIIAPTYVQLPATELKNMEQVSTKPVIMERVLLLEDHYARYDDTYKALAEQGQMPSWQLYSEHDFQMFWLLSVDKVIKDLKAYEAANGIHLQSLMTLDFTDPLPWLLDRKPTPYIQIAADPDRTLPPITDRIKASVAATDGVLRPHCPETWARLALRKFYAEPLQGRTVVKLNPCWDLLLRPGILPQKAG